MSDELPDPVRRFVAANIHSVAELEALLLLRASPTKEWRSEEIATRLFIQVSRAREVLTKLSQEGLIEATSEADYRYAAPPELRQVIDQTAETHAKQLLALTKFIHTLRVEAHQFSEAFRLRKDRS